jgi:5-methylcytosine-specific restriction protein B
MNGATITSELVEEIKQRIRRKDTHYFSHLPETVVKEMLEYELGKRDLFANWQRPWAVFHPFFYRGTVKETTQLYLGQLCGQLRNDLDLKDYDFHWVDFYGASNFGSDWSWLALFPIQRESHKDGYQFFIRISHTPEAGRVAGHELVNPQGNLLHHVNSYTEALAYLEKVKPGILQLNNESKNHYKLSPGSQAVHWKWFYEDGIAAIDYTSTDIGDLSQYKSLGEVNLAVGLPENSSSNVTWNLWLFKTANIGDIVFANKGVNSAIGIGIIESDYYYDGAAATNKQRRKINWITNKVYNYKPNTLTHYKTLFRPDTFSPTKVWEFILQEYLRLYPELRSLFIENGLIPDAEAPVIPPTIAEPEDYLGDEGGGAISYWWLNANPKIWKINNYAEGQRQTYTSHNEKGNKRRIYRYFEEIRPGDIIIGYESSPSKLIKATYTVTKGLHTTQNGEEIEFELTEKLEIPIHWNELKNNPLLQNCEVFRNNQGSLFSLTPDEYDVIREIIDERNIPAVNAENNGITPYNYNTDTDKPFIAEITFKETVELLKRKKNIILQGPPGVGKTFIARKIAYECMHEERKNSIEMVQFHQSYSYEDFIQGLRPTLNGSFEIRDGIFYNFCQRALSHPERDFFFIIDEINRGNLSKIFGELMMLIECDKRDEKFALKLTYSEGEDDRFYIPQNLYIIGTMNTADRSLAIVDYALRRRFAFVSMHPEYGRPFRSFLAGRGVSEAYIDHICDAVNAVNKKICDDRNLGEGFQIGHSYFCSFIEGEDETLWWDNIIKFELKPLLEEIWFDDKGRVAEMERILKK